MNHRERVTLIERDHPALSIARQANLIGVSRASLYYTPAIDHEDIRIMHAIDEIFTECPFYGSRKIRAVLKDQGIHICREHVQRLMRIMGIEAIYPKTRKTTSIPDDSHRKYPYLLSGITASHPNHVWGTDITYIRLEDGWAYLVALMDWFSRYVLAWELSPTMETDFCIVALRRALASAMPEIHNSDQGTQFTAAAYTSILEGRNIKISMDGRGRCFDNIFTERLWRNVKYEHVYLHDRRNIHETRHGLDDYFMRYNTKRPHQSLNYRTPADIYFHS